MIVRCRYPSGEVKEFDKLPDPPVGARWIFEGSAYSVDRYSLVLPEIKITFSNEFGKWSCSNKSIPKDENLPPIPKREGYLGYWDIPKMILEPITLFPTYVELRSLMPVYGTGVWINNGKEGCPYCHSAIRLGYDESKRKYFTNCVSCSYKGPGKAYIKFIEGWTDHNRRAEREKACERYRNSRSGGREGKCPRCNSDLYLCQNSTTFGWFSSCSRCSYTGPPGVYFNEVNTRYW